MLARMTIAYLPILKFALRSERFQPWLVNTCSLKVNERVLRFIYFMECFPPHWRECGGYYQRVRKAEKL